MSFRIGHRYQRNVVSGFSCMRLTRLQSLTTNRSNNRDLAHMFHIIHTTRTVLCRLPRIFFFGTTSRLKARAWGLSYGGVCYVALEAIGTIAYACRGFDNRHALKSANSSSYKPHTPRKYCLIKGRFLWQNSHRVTSFCLIRGLV